MNTDDELKTRLDKLDKLREQRAKLRRKVARRDVKICYLKAEITGYQRAFERERAKYESACEKIEKYAAEIKDLRGKGGRVDTAEQQAQELTAQRDRLVQLADELGRRARVSIDPASTIALDLIRWSDWIDERPQQPITGTANDDRPMEDVADARMIITAAREFERARLAAILRTHYDEDADRVTFGEFESCSDQCPGIVMDHVLKLLDTP